MVKKKDIKLIGMSLDKFKKLLKSDTKERKIIARKAHLIPTDKKLDELSLASVFLASLTMVKEFKDQFCREINLSRVGSLIAYTEVSFPQLEIYNDDNVKKGPLRVDGLLLQIVGGKIKDGALFEMKMGSQEIQSKQINAYLEIAKRLEIPRLISISNQFVPTPTDYPIEVQRNNFVSLYHFSWRYVVALGSILLTDNDLNISDPDQVLIMNEVMTFLQHPNAAVNTFDKMSKAWVDVVNGLRARKVFTKDNLLISMAVQDWIQEEQDLALKMSDQLGIMVDCNKKQYKTMQDRIEGEKKNIIENGILESQFRIKGAVSTLYVQSLLKERMIVCYVDIKAPLDRKSASARLNWLKRQIDKCKSNNDKLFSTIESNLWIKVIVKGRKVNYKELLVDYDLLIEEADKNKCDVRKIKISYENELAGRFTQNKKFIEEYEKMVIMFYSVLVQNLKNWEGAPPKMNAREIVEEEYEPLQDDSSLKDMGED